WTRISHRDAWRRPAHHRGVLVSAPGRALRKRPASRSSSVSQLLAGDRLLSPGGAPTPPGCRPCEGRSAGAAPATQVSPRSHRKVGTASQAAASGSSRLTTPHEAPLGDEVIRLYSYRNKCQESVRGRRAGNINSTYAADPEAPRRSRQLDAPARSPSPSRFWP